MDVWRILWFGVKDEMLYDLNLEVLNEDEVVGFEIVILGIFEIDVFDEVNG